MKNFKKFTPAVFLMTFVFLVSAGDVFASTILGGTSTGASIYEDYGTGAIYTGNENFYSIISNNNGPEVFTLTPESNFDAALFFFTDLSDPSGSLLNYVDASAAGGVETLSVDVLAGDEIFLAIDGFNSNGSYSLEFPFTIEIMLVNPVPVPASVWLFGSGLLGLITLARRKG